MQTKPHSLIAIILSISFCLWLLQIRLSNQILKRQELPVRGILSDLQKPQTEETAPSPDGINRNSTDAIVYLAQFGHHSTYGQQTDGLHPITGVSKLNKSLELLHTNFIHQFPCDVIVLYGADETPDPSLLTSLQRNRPHLQFHRLPVKYWSIPPTLNTTLSKWRYPGFSVGYRHMMQLYAINLWPYLTELGYTHVMRLDDDSYIYSKVGYDLFEFMRGRKMRYAFRQPVIELNVGGSFYNLVEDYIKTLPSSTIPPQNLWYFNENKFLSFYNNFFIADISFFMTPPVSDLLRVIDDSKKIYEERLGDLFIHSVLVRLFLPFNQILWIRDFTYEHTTLSSSGPNKGCFQNGGVSRGIGAHTEKEWEDIADAFEHRFLHNTACNKAVRTRTHVGAGDIERCEDMGGRCGMCLSEFSSKPDW